MVSLQEHKGNENSQKKAQPIISASINIILTNTSNIVL